MRQLATSWRQRFAIKYATLRQFSHLGLTEMVITTYLRMSHECRTIIARIIGEFGPEFAWSSHTCCATVARHSRDTRAMFAQWNCEYFSPTTVARCSRERRTTVARRSCNSRTMIMRENEKSRTYEHSSNYLIIRRQERWIWIWMMTRLICWGLQHVCLLSLSQLSVSSSLFQPSGKPWKLPSFRRQRQQELGRILLRLLWLEGQVQRQPYPYPSLFWLLLAWWNCKCVQTVCEKLIYVRVTWDENTNHSRHSCEIASNLRHSHDTRETFVRMSHDVRANVAQFYLLAI